MQNGLSKISAILLIPMIIFASGGINIFTHFCHNSNETSISILQSPECDHQHNNCCHEHSENNNCQTHSTEKSCCENHHIFIKTVEWNFFESQNNFEFNFRFIQSLCSSRLLAYKAFLLNLDPDQYTDYSSPPRFSPKYTSIFQQKLRLDC